MDNSPASTAAAMAGLAENPNFPADQRLACAKQALDYYVGQAGQLEELQQWAEDGIAAADDEAELKVFSELSARLERILQ